MVSLFGNVPRTKSVSQIIEKLEVIHPRGWRDGIFFVDDNFIGNKKKLKEEVPPALIEWARERNYPFTFFTEASINIADDEELMDLLVPVSEGLSTTSMLPSSCHVQTVKAK